MLTACGSALAGTVDGGADDAQRAGGAGRRAGGCEAGGEQLEPAVAAAAGGLGRAGAGVAPAGARGDVRRAPGRAARPGGGRCGAARRPCDARRVGGGY